MASQASQYSPEEDAQWAELNRLEEARRVGMGLRSRPGTGLPPRRPPASQQPPLPAHLGGPPLRMPYGRPGSIRNPIVRGRENPEPGTRPNPNMIDGNKPGSLRNPNVVESAAQVAARQLPTKGVSTMQPMPGALAPAQPAQPVDQESVVKASAQGFSNGFLGGITQKLGMARQEGAMAAPKGMKDMNETQRQSAELVASMRAEEVAIGNSFSAARMAADARPDSEWRAAHVDVDRREADHRLMHYANNDTERTLAASGNVTARKGLPTADQDAQRFASELPSLAMKSENAMQMLIDDSGPTAAGYLSAMNTVNNGLMAASGVAGVTGAASGLGLGQDGMPSALGAIAEVAEAAEEGAGPSADVAARLNRWPELQGVEVPTGNAARFPELAEEAPRPDTQQQEQDGDYDR